MTAPSHRTVPLAVVSPVRDEAAHIRRTLDAMVAQRCRPQEWLIVDDGSSDDTPAIVEDYARQHDFIRLIDKPDRGARVLGGGVIEAFDYGRARLSDDNYRYIAKLDGDMSFDPRYIEIMLDAFAADDRLAAVSGKVFRPEGDRLVLEYMTDEHVAGQFKLYRREAFEDIGGFERTILWDGIDIHRCRMHGWRTRSFHHPEARLYHHRQMGSSDRSVYHGRIRLGRGLYFMGYSPWYILASGLFRMHEKPYVIGGLLMILSYGYAMLRREPRYPDPAFRRDLRAWQHRRLRALLASRLRGLVARFRRHPDDKR